MFAIFSLPLLYFFFGLVVCDVSICLTSTLVAEGWEWRGWCWEHQVTHCGGGDQRLVTILPTCFTCHTIPNIIYVNVAYLTCRHSSCGCWSCYFGDECQSDLSHVKATFAFLLCWNLSSHELWIVTASLEMNLSFVLCSTCQLTWTWNCHCKFVIVSFDDDKTLCLWMWYLCLTWFVPSFLSKSDCWCPKNKGNVVQI